MKTVTVKKTKENFAFCIGNSKLFFSKKELTKVAFSLAQMLVMPQSHKEFALKDLEIKSLDNYTFAIKDDVRKLNFKNTKAFKKALLEILSGELKEIQIGTVFIIYK